MLEKKSFDEIRLFLKSPSLCHEAVAIPHLELTKDIFNLKV
jgi:hypothetical protein